MVNFLSEVTLLLTVKHCLVSKATLDKAVLQQFVQLRVDYRTAKLAKHFIN